MKKSIIIFTKRDDLYSIKEMVESCIAINTIKRCSYLVDMSNDVFDIKIRRFLPNRCRGRKADFVFYDGRFNKKEINDLIYITLTKENILSGGDRSKVMNINQLQSVLNKGVAEGE